MNVPIHGVTHDVHRPIAIEHVAAPGMGTAEVKGVLESLSVLERR
jgi:hypothetical protein